jgi:geranylgeranyl pyrophosphate synthase
VSSRSTADASLDAYIGGVQARVDAVLAGWGGRLDDLWRPPIPDAVRYSLLSAGKRLRPTLLCAAYEALGGIRAEIADLAAAVEVVHAYSLVHDDLPCMDDDDLRRGQPTTHRAFDVATATAAGYRMVGLAARVLAHGAAALGLPPERSAAIAGELFRAAGAGGMIGGQALDLESEGRQLAPGQLAEMHRRKTGALIAASCVIGGLAVPEATPDGIASVRAYGEAIGLAFQIADDVLDATATSDQLGKTAGRDAALAKSTFVTALGVGGARAEAERLAAEAVDRLRRGGLSSPILVALAHYIVTRSR